MKKQGTTFLLMLTLVFGAFSIGFFVGRNYTRTPVQVSAVQPLNHADETSQSPSAAGTTSAQASSDAAELIDINTADQQTLMLLPGVGEVLSQRIIDYREANGPFQALSELLNVNGIGQSRLEAILPLATVGG